MKRIFLFISYISLFFILSGCATPVKPTEKSNAVFTAAAETVSVQLTLSAERIKLSPTVTPTLPATATPTLPVVSPIPQTQPSVTLQKSPTNPPVTSSCDQADFVADVLIPDGTTLNPGLTFTKTWKLMNAGTCAWKTTYSLAFSGGDRLGGLESVKIPQEVAPGAIIELSIELKAPEKAGSYTSYFKLVNQNGERFGIKPNNAAFWVKITVGSVTNTPTAATPTTAGNTPTTASTISVPPTLTPTRTNTPTPTGTKTP